MKAPASARWSATGCARADLPQLQAFYEANPGYWLLVHGTPPQPDEALRDFDTRPPADIPYSALHDWLIRDSATQRIVGEVGVAADLPAPGVMHLGFFIVEDAQRGTGLAHEVYRSYEDWAIAQGARWLRLGVVESNHRARRFWQRVGYREVRRRSDVQIGALSHELIVMVKPLGANSLQQYHDVVARDRPQ